MKNPETMDDLLQARLDGDLDAAGERRLREAESADPDFAAETQGMQRMVEDLGRLPHEIEPPRDLLPEILSRVPRQASPRRVLWPLAAALVAAIALAFMAGRWSGGEPFTSAMVADAPPPAATAASDRGAKNLNAATSALGLTRLELRRAFESSRADLPPATLALVEENLATIERAMVEIEAAIAANPTNRDLGRLLVAYQVKEIALLEKAHRAADRL